LEVARNVCRYHSKGTDAKERMERDAACYKTKIDTIFK
jgi:hypothetical protein